jgi:hypothetical protein
MSATQNIYSNVWAFQRGNETTALADLDEYCFPTCGPNTAPRFFQRQFSSLYAWSNVGGSSYNAGQLILRHAMSRGVQFDFTYTFSNSIDLGSDTERTNELNGTGSTLYNSGGSFSEIVNTFHPEFNRAVSDFDTRHLVNTDWVIQLPFGSGQHFLNSGGRIVRRLCRGMAVIRSHSLVQRFTLRSRYPRMGHELAAAELCSADRSGEDPSPPGQWSAAGPRRSEWSEQWRGGGTPYPSCLSR